MDDKNVFDLKQKIERELLPFVEKPMRYIGNELNSVVKNCNQVSLHGVLCFPEIYDIGMSHHGSHILYHIVNNHQSWSLARCYHPWIDAEDIMRKNAIPLYSLEYFTPICQADWLGFSLQYELHYTNFINMLDLAGIPLFSKERNEHHPLIICGGPCMTNPEPIADFCDACVIGDGEEVIVKICTLLERFKQQHESREKELIALSELPGVYVPALYPVEKEKGLVVPQISSNKPPVKITKVKTLCDSAYPQKQLVPLMEIVHDRFCTEIMRGCTRACRFCAAGIYYRPVRERSVSSIIGQMTQGMIHNGWGSAGLLSLSTADYSGFQQLLEQSKHVSELSNTRLSLPSTRIDALNEQLLQALNACAPATSFTIAPEAGSQRLRDVINKDFTEETILQTVKTLLRNNIQTIKLYFMIGLPTETDDDIAAVIQLVMTIAHLTRAVSRRRNVHVSISPFSPKPHTPFQWEAMESKDQLLYKGKKIKSALRHLKNVKVSYRNPDMTFLETVLIRGDRALSQVIHEAWEQGARFDGWDDRFSLHFWELAAEKCHIDLHTYVQQIPVEQILPWQSIHCGVHQSFLLQERQRAYQAAITKDCRSGPCYHCGACDDCTRVIISDTAADCSQNPVDVSYIRTCQDNHNQRFLYRYNYSKENLARFIGHRTLVSLFHSAMRASNIPIVYSKGFHSLPQFSFAPPLPMGIMGSAELFDIQTHAPLDIEKSFFPNLLPEGIHINRIVPLYEETSSLHATIVAAAYTFIPIQPTSDNELSKAVENITSRDSLVIDVEKKGKQMRKDLKPLIHEIRVMRNADTSGITAVLSLLPANTCRPDELLRCLFPSATMADFIITRTACLMNDNGFFSQVL